jgi:hypothetical protein
MTECNVFLVRAAKYSARLVISQVRNCSFRIPASFTSCRLQGQVESFGNASAILTYKNTNYLAVRYSNMASESSCR